MKAPKNSQEYWELLNSQWNGIYKLCNIYLSTFRNFWIDGEKLSQPLGDYLIELKERQDTKLIRALHACWWNCSDDLGDWDDGFCALKILIQSEFVILEPVE